MTNSKTKFTSTKLYRDIIAKTDGITKLAHHLDIRHTAIYSWKQVPSKRVLSIEGLTGISRHKIRPDLYPQQTAGQ